MDVAFSTFLKPPRRSYVASYGVSRLVLLRLLVAKRILAVPLGVSPHALCHSCIAFISASVLKIMAFNVEKWLINRPGVIQLFT